MSAEAWARLAQMYSVDPSGKVRSEILKTFALVDDDTRNALAPGILNVAFEDPEPDAFYKGVEAGCIEDRLLRQTCRSGTGCRTVVD